MPVAEAATEELNVAVKVSRDYRATIEMLRGKIPLNEYLCAALMIGLGHLHEEAIQQHRQKIYERLASQSDGFNAARNAQTLELAA